MSRMISAASVVVTVERMVGGRDNRGIAGEAEVIVGAQVDYFPAGDADESTLWRVDFPLSFVQTLFAQSGEILYQSILKSGVHEAHLQIEGEGAQYR